MHNENNTQPRDLLSLDINNITQVARSFISTQILNCTHAYSLENVNIPIFDVSGICNNSINTIKALAEGWLSLIYPANCTFTDFIYCGVETENIGCEGGVIYLSEPYFNFTNLNGSSVFDLDQRAVARIQGFCNQRDVILSGNSEINAQIGTIIAATVVGVTVLNGFVYYVLNSYFQGNNNIIDTPEEVELIAPNPSTQEITIL